LSYKFILTAVSSVGDAHQKSDEFYFADGLTSVIKNACNSVRTRNICKGRKHIFSVISCREHFSMLCDYLYHALMKRNNDKVRIKVQYALRAITDEIYAMTGKEDDSRMSMLYIDGSNIYASGFGDTHIYHISKNSTKATKVTFQLPTLSDAIISDGEDSEADERSVNTWSRCLGKLNAKDEYLIVGSYLQSLLGDDAVCDVLSASHINSPSVLADKAHMVDSSCTVSALHIMVKKTFPALWISLGASLFAIALALFFLI